MVLPLKAAIYSAACALWNLAAGCLRDLEQHLSCGHTPAGAICRCLRMFQWHLLQVLERALRCCTLGVVASTNDAHWVAFAGEAIDVMAFGIARYILHHEIC